MQIDEKKIKETGIRLYIRKPVLRSEIAKAIRNVIEEEALSD
jgi:hypothetical protein